MTLVAALYLSFLLTTLLVFLFMKIASRLGVMIDHPNSRKIHKEPIPRIGGPAVVIGTLLPLIVLHKGKEVMLGLCLGAMCILVTGLLDDVWDLSYQWKFVGQVSAATVTLLISGIRLHTIGHLWQGFPQELGWFSLPASIFFLVATTNMINLSDGLDGLAGGICFLIFCAVGFLAYFQGSGFLLALSICTLGAISGFLRYNTHPATVFMGDTGSQFLGFAAGFSMLLLTQGRTSYSPIIPLYLIGIPIIDTVMVIFERLRQGRPIFKADRNHIHHKLLKMGLRHNESVMVIYALQFGMILIAWTGRYADSAILFVSFLFLTGLSVYFFSLESRVTWVVKSPLKISNPNNVKTERVGSLILSKKKISTLTWYGMVCMLSFFYFISPFLLKSVPKVVGFFSFTMIVCIVAAKKLNDRYINVFVTISLYFLGLYYIFFTEYSQNSLYLSFQYRFHFNLIFFALSMCYIVNVVSTDERLSFTTNDFLLLSVVIFLFFLPRDYSWTIHLRRIAVKSFLIMICIGLISKTLKTEIRFTVPPVITALGLNFLVCVLPFINEVIR
jgi:UDP-GlcNAc:undecaprenyl-phosphate GlcNAc-1-phosphate transferase